MIRLDAAQFISDLHLSSGRPDILRRFLRFMHGPALESGALFVLGDLFEYWPGDDLLDQDSVDGDCARTVLMAFSKFTTSRRSLYLLRGNRDFLLGGRFFQATGSSLLEDGILAAISNHAVELLHGDALCTDDDAYQKFKRIVRSNEWREGFLAKSLAERHAAMARMREESEQAKSGNAPVAMDVNPDAVLAEFARTGADMMVHGHTHRPARHHHKLPGRTAMRWVLPAWYESGGYLTIDTTGARPGSLSDS
jgi:UDP-2,3-diacylglucosamine hydrolase